MRWRRNLNEEKTRRKGVAMRERNGNQDSIEAALALLLWGLFAVGVWSYGVYQLTAERTVREMQREAVDAGCGRFVPTKYGTQQFEWRSQPTEQTKGQP